MSQHSNRHSGADASSDTLVTAAAVEQIADQIPSDLQARADPEPAYVDGIGTVRGGDVVVLAEDIFLVTGVSNDQFTGPMLTLLSIRTRQTHEQQADDLTTALANNDKMAYIQAVVQPLTENS